MEPFIGMIVAFGGNFAPRGWALCDGQLLSINSHSALFSILGTTYGGDGVSTFALPDLRGRVAIHPGRGPGLSSYNLGQKGGTETVTLTTNQMPSHKHTLQASTSNGNQNQPGNHSLAAYGTPGPPVASGPYSDQAANTSMNSSGMSNTGGGQPFNILQPYQAVNFIIALVGTYPSRS